MMGFDVNVPFVFGVCSPTFVLWNYGLGLHEMLLLCFLLLRLRLMWCSFGWWVVVCVLICANCLLLWRFRLYEVYTDNMLCSL